MTWSLADPGMDLLERAGLAGLYMTLRAAEDEQIDLSPLTWGDEDLKPDSVTLRWDGPDREAFTKLFEWAWQVRDGVLYLPGVHRGAIQRGNVMHRLAMHSGVLSTFLQHPRVQPKGEPVTKIFTVDTDKQIESRYLSMSGTRLKPIADLADFFDKRGALVEKPVSLSSWVMPGCAPRFKTDVHAWQGAASIGLIAMLAPIACSYARMRSGGVNWIFVVPDVRDLEEFDQVRPGLSLDTTFSDVASLGDAGLRFVAAYVGASMRAEIPIGCRTVVMGKVAYYSSQNVRKGVVDVPYALEPVRRYEHLQRVMPTMYKPRARPAAEGAEDAKKPRRAKAPRSKAKTGGAPGGEATAFVKVPTFRGPIADNLVSRRQWYDDLFTPPAWERDALEAKRKLAPGESIESIWFREAIYQKDKLRELVQTKEMWDRPEEKTFVEAFWEALASLYAQEAQGVSRGGERKAQERMADLNEDIRRRLSRAKTRELLRETLADLFSRAGRQPTAREHSALIWNLMNDPHDWKKARDLALLALATYQGKERSHAAEAKANETGGEAK